MARLMERLQKVDNDSPTDSATDSQPDKVSVVQNLLFFVTESNKLECSALASLV
jgi:hypothetical protein